MVLAYDGRCFCYNGEVEMGEYRADVKWDNEFCNAVAKQTASGKNVIWLDDDYTPTDDHDFTESLIREYKMQSEKPDFEPDLIYVTDFSLKDKYIVNVFNDQYVDCNGFYNSQVSYKDGEPSCCHPLPLLTYVSNSSRGVWAGDLLMIIDEKPKIGTELLYDSRKGWSERRS